MTRRNDKRNNRRNRQRNNTPELPAFAQMLFGAIVGKGVDMITEALMKKAEEKKEDKPHTGIRQSGNLLESSCIINNDGSATEIPIPDGYQIFISEDGKPMIRKKIEGDEKPTDAVEGKPITYDDICKKLFCNNKIYWAYKEDIESGISTPSDYKDVENCTSEAQVKRLIAFNKLQNIAKYLNDGWKPDLDDTLQEKFYIASEGLGEAESDFPIDLIKHYGVYCQVDEPVYPTSIYFKSSKVAHDAVLLMGKDSLNDLFSTDW